MNIALVGSGNTATVLGRLCNRSGHRVVQVLSRNESTARELATLLEADHTTDWDKLTQYADVYLIALPDSALANLHLQLNLKKGIAVHTAGSVDMEVLKSVSKNHGVLYPLQSLRASETHIGTIPFLIDGNTIEDKTLLMDFASTLSPMVAFADNKQRLYLHLAAVWANNFSNFLFTEAWHICQKHGVEFKMLLPLMEHTVGRLHFSSPADMQTGPAIRRDFSTIKKHLELLADNPEAQNIYRLLSDAISRYHTSEK
jgi:predicted short-subunit dehydrogenase-like oxidoreductase (DUF2520 family)